MRIIAGKWRSTPLAQVGKGDAGAHLRPTSDRVRESLFSMLAHLNVISGARVLDLFAGTGALSFEALSRGATSAVLVESGRIAQKLITQNIEKLQAADQVTLMRNDATKLGAWEHEKCDLVFLDPPYSKGIGEKALRRAAQGGWFAPDATIIWEESAPMPAPNGFALRDTRRYGGTHVTILDYLGPTFG